MTKIIWNQVGTSWYKPAQDTSIEKAKALIQNQLNWGKSENWTNQDFHALSELIQVKTGCRLSAVTLKRICGRIKYDSVPNTNTLY